MSDALLGWGTTFQVGSSDSPGTWTTVAEVDTIGGPDLAVDTLDTSNEFPPDSFRESIPGMKEGGDITISFNFIPGNSASTLLLAEIGNPTIKARRIVFPNGRYWQFAAYIKGFSSTEAAGDKLGGTASFRITGSVSLV